MMQPPEAALQLGSLQWLHLSNNRIRTITVGAFRRLENLQSLLLNDNLLVDASFTSSMMNISIA